MSSFYARTSQNAVNDLFILQVLKCHHVLHCTHKGAATCYKTWPTHCRSHCIKY